jgi:hypothetical protein
MATTPAEATQPTRSTNDFMRMFKELKTAIVPDGKIAIQAAPVTEDELALKVRRADFRSGSLLFIAASLRRLTFPVFCAFQHENSQIVELEVKLTDTTRKVSCLGHTNTKLLFCCFTRLLFARLALFYQLSDARQARSQITQLNRSSACIGRAG